MNKDTFYGMWFDGRYKDTCPICKNIIDKCSHPKYLLITECVSNEFEIDSGIYRIWAYSFYNMTSSGVVLYISSLDKTCCVPEETDGYEVPRSLFYVCGACAKKQLLLG